MKNEQRCEKIFLVAFSFYIENTVFVKKCLRGKYMKIFSVCIVGLMTVFALIGIVDLLFNKCRWGLGDEFKRGIEMIGPLVLSMGGIISFVPLLSWLIQHSISILYSNLGLDSSMAVTTILAIDMGGYQLAMSVASNEQIGNWAGIVYGSMMGATIVFTIPVGVGIVRKEDLSFFAKGILFGIIAIPFGTFVGGLMIGIPILTVLLNLIPPVIFSAIIALCLIFFPNGTIKVFKVFANIINILGIIQLGIAMVKDLVLVPLSDAGYFDITQVPFFNMIDSTANGIQCAGSIGLVLAGALPFIACLKKLLSKSIKKVSTKGDFSEAGITGYLLTTANNVAMFSTLKDMKDREKIINVAFAVCGAFVIGDHLAFTAANAPDYIAPMMVSKIVSGAIAILLALGFTKQKNITTLHH